MCQLVGLIDLQVPLICDGVFCATPPVFWTLGVLARHRGDGRSKVCSSFLIMSVLTCR